MTLLLFTKLGIWVPMAIKGLDLLVKSGSLSKQALSLTYKPSAWVSVEVNGTVFRTTQRTLLMRDNIFRHRVAEDLPGVRLSFRDSLSVLQFPDYLWRLRTLAPSAHGERELWDVYSEGLASVGKESRQREAIKRELAVELDILKRINFNEEYYQVRKRGPNLYYVDRDDRYFRPVMNYLRHGQIYIDPTLDPQGVMQEAVYYQASGLVQELEKRGFSRPPDPWSALDSNKTILVEDNLADAAAHT